MRYDDPTLRRQLAGAYALGTLRGTARRRWERLMQQDRELRRLVVEFQEDLVPLALAAPEVRPPARVRSRLAAAIAPPTRQSAEPGWWQRLGFWRGLAGVNAALAVALIAFIGVGVLRQAPPVASELVYVGVLSDASDQPKVAVLAYNRPFRLEITAKDALSAPPGAELRLWIRERDTDRAVFLRAIPAGEKVFALDDERWKLLRDAKALLITRGTIGTPTAVPGGEILYQGVCVNLKKWSNARAGG